MEKIRAAKKVAPDSGWGWVVTFGVSMVNVSIMMTIIGQCFT